ncbi:MAG: hypothetical protein ACK47B_02090 [Armatimonadota bacterium]
MPSRSSLLLVLLALLIPLPGELRAEPGAPEPPPVTAPEPETKPETKPESKPEGDEPASSLLRAGWSKLLLEEALRSVESSGKPFDFLCDSFDADDLRPERIAFAAPPREVSRALAEDYDRTRLYSNGVYLFRHSRWSDARFRLLGSGEASPRPQSLEVQAVPAVGDGKPLLRISALRVPLEELLRKLGEVTGTQYEVSGSLRERKVSGSLTLVTPEIVRELLGVLFPDAAWSSRPNGAWSLRERPSAELIYVLAQAAEQREGATARARDAIHVQVAAALTPEELLLLQRTRRLRRSWGQLDPVTRELLLLCGEVFLHTVRESGGDPDRFLDLTRQSDLGVELVKRGPGIQLRLLGRGGDGEPVAW